jgi:hypothetical protein
VKAGIQYGVNSGRNPDRDIKKLPVIMGALKYTNNFK